MGTERPEITLPPVAPDSETPATDQVVRAGCGYRYRLDDCKNDGVQNDNGSSGNNGEQQ